MRGKGKRGRHLARYVSIFLLSGGYTLPSLLPVYAAPVTGQSVTVDASHPAVTSSDPTNTPAGEPTHLAVAAGDAPAGNVGDVTGNSLTIQATSASTMSGILNVYAGRMRGIDRDALSRHGRGIHRQSGRERISSGQQKNRHIAH